MILFICDVCKAVIKPNEEFYGITLYKLTPQGDYMSEAIHLCKGCFSVVYKVLGSPDVQYTKIKSYIQEEEDG